MGTEDWSVVVSSLLNVETLAGSADPDVIKLVFPAYRVTNSSPPTMTIHGTWDTVVPYSDAAALHDALESAGVKHLLISMPWYPHVLESGYYSAGAQMHRFAFERLLVT